MDEVEALKRVSDTSFRLAFALEHGGRPAERLRSELNDAVADWLRWRVAEAPPTGARPPAPPAGGAGEGG